MTPLGKQYLRHAVLLVLVDGGRPMSVQEIVAGLAARGIEPARMPASRAVSDAMRADVSKGRVARIGWGRYVAKASTPGHLRYARRCVREAVAAGRERAA